MSILTQRRIIGNVQVPKLPCLKKYTPEESRFKEKYFPQKAKCDVAHYRSLHFDFTCGVFVDRRRGPIADKLPIWHMFHVSC